MIRHGFLSFAYNKSEAHSLGTPCKERKNGMKIVIIRSPRLLAPLLGRLFGVKCKKGDKR